MTANLADILPPSQRGLSSIAATPWPRLPAQDNVFVDVVVSVQYQVRCGQYESESCCRRRPTATVACWVYTHVHISLLLLCYIIHAAGGARVPLRRCGWLGGWRDEWAWLGAGSCQLLINRQLYLPAHPRLPSVPAFYKLTDSRSQITSYVFDEVRRARLAALACWKHLRV